MLLFSYYTKIGLLIFALSVLIYCPLQLSQNLKDKEYSHTKAGKSFNRVMGGLFVLMLTMFVWDFPAIMDLRNAMNRNTRTVEGIVTQGSTYRSQHISWRTIEVLDQATGQVTKIQIIWRVQTGEQVYCEYLPHSHIALDFEWLESPESSESTESSDNNEGAGDAST